MNKWRVAGDDAAFRANEAIWIELGLPTNKFSRFFARAKERGKVVERTLRYAIRRRKKPRLALGAR
jgi:hypothetical protein